MSKKRIIAMAMVMALAVGMVSGCGEKKDTANDGANNTSSEEQVKVTPTFMYFVSNSDAEFDATNAMIEELKKEYDGKIKFDIVNIDENSEAAKNFPVQGQTPALIMLNTSNDISAMEFQCNDKEKLKSDIEEAIK